MQLRFAQMHMQLPLPAVPCAAVGAETLLASIGRDGASFEFYGNFWQVQLEHIRPEPLAAPAHFPNCSDPGPR